MTVDMVWDDPGPAPIRHSPTKDGGSAAVAATSTAAAMRRRHRRQQQCGGAAIGWRRRWQHLWRKCIHWHCTLVFGSFKHHHDCILPLSLLDGYSYCIFVISNLSTLMQLTVYFCKICSIFVIFIHHKLVTFEV